MPTYHAVPLVARQHAMPAPRPHRAGRATMRLMCIALSSVTAAAAFKSVSAQPAIATSSASVAAEQIAAGDRESLARRPLPALAAYERALDADARSYDALWKATREAVDLGEFERQANVRSAYFAKAVGYARRAVSVNPGDPEGHFHLSRALGRTALALGPRDRVKYGIEVRQHALDALRVAPRHPGALHVMGVWNAEIMRLSGFSRAIAKTFLGGQIFGTASWAEAIRYLELAVEIEPNRLVHRLDLARIYRDVGRRDDARRSYEAALAAPLYDSGDPTYRTQAETELRALK